MRTISIVNYKGGCGKTTTAINISAAFAAMGHRVLLIDLDAQSHATIGLGLDPDSLDKTIYDPIADATVHISEVIKRTGTDRLDLAPSNVYLASAELELPNMSGRLLHLTGALTGVADEYDLCVIDCPPALGSLTLNALVASTGIISPVQVHYYPLQGLKQLLKAAAILRERFHPCSVEVLGLLLTFVEEKTLLSSQIQHQIRQLFGDLVFNTVIHTNVRLIEAPSAGESVLTYAPESRAAADYTSLAEEALASLEAIEKAPALAPAFARPPERRPSRWPSARPAASATPARVSSPRPPRQQDRQGLAEKAWDNRGT
ncbi:MAG: ParA family protein [Planctomycetota bacterium]|jgi:chromosome partitioning protein